MVVFFPTGHSNHQMDQNGDMDDQELGQPARFTPSWPPRDTQDSKPNIFTRVSDKFKKVTWPPNGPEVLADVAPPPSNVQLLAEIPLNDTAIRPVGTYKAAPTAYAESPDIMPIEEIWPPPVDPNLDERVIHDPERPKRAIRDYTVYFKQNAAPPVQATYQVPPGTLHVISKRGVLSYDTPDLGGARMAQPDDNKK